MTKEHSLGELYYQYSILAAKYDTLLEEKEKLQENCRTLETLLAKQQTQTNEDS